MPLAQLGQLAKGEGVIPRPASRERRKAAPDVERSIDHRNGASECLYLADLRLTGMGELKVRNWRKAEINRQN
jgi:hypothetical protein